MLSIGFQSSKTYVYLFIYSQDSTQVYLLVYVDDILIMGSDPGLVSLQLAKLSTGFKICDLGAPSFFLAIQTV